MTERDDLLRRVAGVDPYPSDQPLPSDISDSRPPVAILIQGGDDIDRVSPLERARTTRWWRGPAVAMAALVVALLVAIPILLIDGSDSPVANTTTAPVSTTVPTTPDEPANAMLVTPEIGAAWTLVATVDDWLTEPSLVDGELFAIRRGLDSNAEPNSEGILEGMVVGFGGEDDGSPPDYWRSVDGVAWTRADEGGPPPSTEAAVAGASVSVERVISEGEGGTRVDNVVMATSSGALPRAINLRPFQNGWMPRVMMGDLGWVVFSPALEVGLAGNGSQAPRIGNLGLWYSPDTETWFEVTDRGPLADNYGDVGPIDYFGEGIVVRDDDILVFAATAEDVGWGIVSQLETEIWRLELSADPTPAAQEAMSTTTTVASTTAAPPVYGAAPLVWDSILATTEAKAAPPAATCPEGATPDVLGPMGQARPYGASWSNQAAAFDQRAGRIVLVDEVGETWTFDVCANTWHAMNPTFDDPGLLRDVFRDGWTGQLVYDVDSDLTITFMGASLAVYDADTNAWTSRPQPEEYDTGLPGWGAVYDPVSGLVVVQTATAGLVAYDVETDAWTPIGGAEDKEWSSYLVGYLTDTDRFVFVSGFGDPGMVLDPRTGIAAELVAPPNDVFAGFGRLDFATNTDTPYVLVVARSVCRLHPATLDWECLTLADGPGLSVSGAGLFAAIVGDPINDRVILIYGYGPGFNGSSYYEANALWAVDFDTGEWT
ncbi:MAG: hypothetical protein WCC01_03785, partial [Acidimicrobiia bacterium]